MLSKKIFLSAALVSMAGFVACGDDSSSNAGDDSNSIPEKVETIDKAIHLNCTEEIKCTMVYVEEVKDNFFCNGTKFEPYSPVLNGKDCPAEEEKKGEEGTEEGSEEGGNGSDDNGNKSEGSEGSENTGDNGGSTEADSSDSSAESSDSNEGGEEVTGPTGDLVSCTMEVFGDKTCDEVAKADEAALSAQCEMLGGTMNTAGGCKAEDFAAKCTCKKGNHYDSSCDGFTCKD